MTSPTRDSPDKRSRIRAAAARSFAERGFDGTTLQMVADEAHAAIGSINHYFDDKEGVASAVYMELADGLVERAMAALMGYGTDVSSAINALLEACHDWAVEVPHGSRVFEVLAGTVSTSKEPRITLVERRLADALATWAAPLPATAIAPRTSVALYALVLGPLMSALRLEPPTAGASDGSVAPWIEVVREAAVGGLRPSRAVAPEVGREVGTPKPKRRVNSPRGDHDLFGDGDAAERPGGSP